MGLQIKVYDLPRLTVVDDAATENIGLEKPTGDERGAMDYLRWCSYLGGLIIRHDWLLHVCLRSKCFVLTDILYKGR